MATNEELFRRCYYGTHAAADELAPLTSAGQLTPGKVAKLRNLLRDAYCAAQELKTRTKKEKHEMATDQHAH
jgi:hypothetical protein